MKIAESLGAVNTYTHMISNLREEKYSIRTDRTYMSFWRIGLVCFFALCKIKKGTEKNDMNKRTRDAP